MEPTKEELKAAIARARDQQFADLLVMILGLAAETHPLEVRTALGQVFDLKGVEEDCKTMVRGIVKIHGDMVQARLELTKLRQEIADLTKHAEALRYEHERNGQLKTGQNLPSKVPAK